MELMIPTPNWRFLDIALKNGADAVYIPVQGFVTISYQGVIFERDEIHKAIDMVHRYGKKAYMVFNVRLSGYQYENIFQAIKEIMRYQPDGIVVGDYNIISWAADNFSKKTEIIVSITADIRSNRDGWFAFLMGADRIIVHWLGLEKLAIFKVDPKLGIDIFVDNLEEVKKIPFNELVRDDIVRGVKILLPDDLKSAAETIQDVRSRIDKAKIYPALSGMR